MKKLLLSTTLVVGAVLSCAAEGVTSDNSNRRAYFGVRLSGDLVCPGPLTAKIDGHNYGEKMFKNGGGFEIGGIYNIPVMKHLYIEPGLKFFYNSVSFTDEYLREMENETHTNLNSMSVRKLGIRIPVMIGYRFTFTDDLNLQIFTGPELEVGFSSKTHIKGGNFDISESNYGDEDGFKRTNFTWAFGAGLNIKQFYVAISGNAGWVNLLKDADGLSYHESRAAITLGYNF